MYETEANRRVEPASEVPDEVRAAFGASRATISARTLLPWSEHCTECVWPTCFTTCELYEPREDGLCRRFVDGMVRVDSPEALNGYLLKIRFKQWGKLWAPGNTRLFANERARAILRRDYAIGAALTRIPRRIRPIATLRRYDFKKRLAQRPSRGRPEASSFMVECYNPHDFAVNVSLTMRSRVLERPIPFQQLLTVEPGFARARIPFEAIARAVDLSAPFTVELVPNIFENGTTLYFGVVDFVREAAGIKCVVWDLDETLWHGILVEDGPEKLRLKPEVAEVVKELDRRGILNSAASKNDAPSALEVLTSFGLKEYFLYPQISWEPKSEGLRRIARNLNISLDALLFVDDSEFELQQVRSACPDVRTWHANRATELLAAPECAAIPTAESAGRRGMYRVEERRREAAAEYKDDYVAFLRDCNITLTIRRLSDASLERAHELTQRTNQMNFSGTRYDKATLRRILADPKIDAYVVECEDRFGRYGTIGFCTVNSGEPRLTDLTFSCRVQAKRVEHALINFLVQKYRISGQPFFANYRRTERNAPSGRVFDDLGFVEVARESGLSVLSLPDAKTAVDDAIITIVEEDFFEGLSA